MKNKKVIACISCSSIVLAATAWLVFKNLALWLIVSDPVPQSLDALFTFGGEDTRVTYSKSLFLKNPHALWVISSDNKKIIQTLGKNGLDTTRILLVDTCSSTSSEISFLNNWISGFIKKREGTAGDKKFSQDPALPEIALVSNWYHMRRIQLIASRRIPKKLCMVSYCSVPLSNNELAILRNKWWNTKAVSWIVYSEWRKILYYQFT